MTTGCKTRCINHSRPEPTVRDILLVVPENTVQCTVCSTVLYSAFTVQFQLSSLQNLTVKAVRIHYTVQYSIQYVVGIERKPCCKFVSYMYCIRWTAFVLLNVLSVCQGLVRVKTLLLVVPGTVPGTVQYCIWRDYRRGSDCIVPLISSYLCNDY